MIWKRYHNVEMEVRKKRARCSRKNHIFYLKIICGVVVTLEDISSNTSASTGIGNSSPTRKAVPVGK